MACNISNGRKDYVCRNLKGGLSAVYVFDTFSDSIINNYSPSAASVDFDDDGSDAVNLPNEVFKFELNNDGNTFEQTSEVNKDAGTSLVTQTGSLVLRKLDRSTQAVLDDLMKSNSQLIVEYRDGNRVLVGMEYGVDYTVGSTSGGAIGDANGYSIGFTATERVLAPVISDFDIDGTSGSQIDPNV